MQQLKQFEKLSPMQNCTNQTDVKIENPRLTCESVTEADCPTIEFYDCISKAIKTL